MADTLYIDLARCECGLSARKVSAAGCIHHSRVAQSVPWHMHNINSGCTAQFGGCKSRSLTERPVTDCPTHTNTHTHIHDLPIYSILTHSGQCFTCYLLPFHTRIIYVSHMKIAADFALGSLSTTLERCPTHQIERTINAQSGCA